jgi:SAM-dependent methyltransferase
MGLDPRMLFLFSEWERDRPRGSGPDDMSTHDFYDNLAPFYHLIYADWEGSLRRQASQLDGIIKGCFTKKISTVLDASCGIGTQAIGLAQLGYQVTASDLSSHEIERAREESRKRGVLIEFSVADMREAFAHHQRQFDLVLSCDNSIPHLLNDGEILSAFKQFHLCLCAGGGLLISVRDYDREDRNGTHIKSYGVRQNNGKRYFIFQVWDFHGDNYDLSMYLVEDARGAVCTTRVMRTKYYAVGTDRLIALMREAGFNDVRRLDDRFFQPVLVGMKV